MVSTAAQLIDGKDRQDCGGIGSRSPDMISWSGTPAHISLAFEDAGVQVVPGGPLEVKEPPFYQWFRSANCRLGLKWSFVEVEPGIRLRFCNRSCAGAKRRPRHRFSRSPSLPSTRE